MKRTNLSRRTIIRLSSYLAALIVTLGAGTIVGYSKSAQYKAQLEATYLRALEDTSSYVSNLSTDLTKGLYSASPVQMSLISSKLYKEASAAKASLSALPVAELHLENTYRFLSQVGDYAMSLSKKAMSGQAITKEETETLTSLTKYASEFGNYISDLEQGITLGVINVNDLEQTALDNKNGAEDAEDNPSQTGFRSMEDTFTGYPNLIYDGPFSDHLLERKPRLIQSMANVTRDAARQKAADAAGVDTQALMDGSDENSQMASYSFYNDNVTIGVTKRGGLVTYMVASHAPTETKISAQDAIQKAKEYLASHGADNMTVTYYDTADHIMTINFAYQQGDVLCYTDLIKVGVAMDSGKIVSYDARGYITNHMERTIAAPKLTLAQAQQKVSSALTVESSQKALIPSSGQNEVLTYEFKTKSQSGEHVLVYINGETGQEEQLLILIETETGVLTK